MLDAFYRAVLPSTGKYALFLGERKQHLWAYSLNELILKTQRLINDGTRALYFATASFVEPKTRSQDNVQLRRCFAFDIDAGPEKFAKHGDAVYPSRDEALAAVVAWCKQHRLAPTYVVSSGAGLHVYFALDSDVTPEEWLPVAKALKARALADGLRIDPAVTADSARVLRPLGASHSSGATVEALLSSGKTYTLARLAEKFPPIVERKRSRLNDDVLAVQTLPRSIWRILPECAAVRAVFDAKGDVSEPYWRAALGLVKHTVEGRDAAHEMSHGHPDYDASETDAKFDRWAMGPSTCESFSQHAPDACARCPHRGAITSPIVLGNPKPEDVPPQELPAAKAIAATPGAAPQSDAASLMAGDESEPAAPRWVPPWADSIPVEQGFSVVVTADGYALARKMMVEVPDPSTGTVREVEQVKPFCRTVFWIESWAEASDAANASATIAMFNPRTRSVHRRTLPLRSVADKRTVLAELAALNIQVFPQTETARKTMHDLVSSAVERIRASGVRARIQDRFGAAFEGDELIITQGRYILRKDGSITYGHVDDKSAVAAAADMYAIPVPRNGSGSWGPEVWPSIEALARDHIEYMNKWFGAPQWQSRQLAIMASLSSPMLAFVKGYGPSIPLPRLGLTLSMYSSETARGKTQAAQAAALAFGHPELLCKSRDNSGATANARSKILSMGGTMPAYFDEAGETDAVAMNDLVRNIANGTLDKERMNSAITVTGGTPSALIALITSNKSARDICAAVQSESSAVQVRMLEVDCSSKNAIDNEARTAHDVNWASVKHRCAGALGAVIHRAMLEIGYDVLNQMGVQCSAKARDLMAATGRVNDIAITEGRYQLMGLASILMLQRVLKSLGIQLFDNKTIVAEFAKAFAACYEFIGDAVISGSPVDRFSLAVNDMMPNIIVTDTYPRHGETCGAPMNARIPEEIHGRLDLYHKILYVRADMLRKWCTDRHLSYESLIGGGRREGILKPIHETSRNILRPINLTRGLKGSPNVSIECFKLDLSRLKVDTSANDDPSEEQPEPTVKVVPIRK